MIGLDYSRPLFLRVRTIGQRLGVLRPVVRLYRRLIRPKYEESFDKMMLKEIRPGDTVWDVGANTGYFTRGFAQIVGDTGSVIAFEPAPIPLEIARKETDGLPNVSLESLALGAEDGFADFFLEENTSTNSLFMKGTGLPTTVQVVAGDSYVSDHGGATPSSIKIDVEGFELEVLQGLDRTLSDPKLRAVFAEIHFQILRERGVPENPGKIVDLLRSKGFSVSWTDPSHLVAKRTRCD